MEYACGDIGASGAGTVFYASSTQFPCGADMTSMCNYLESAPNLWAPNSQNTCKKTGSPCGGSNQNTSDFSFSGKGITWCTGGYDNKVISGAGATAIGSGLSNTLAIIPVCGSGSAAIAAQQYEGGGESDWALPSSDELWALNEYPDRAAIGGFNSESYWGSSQRDAKHAVCVFMGGNRFGCGSTTKGTSVTAGVRPVRAY